MAPRQVDLKSESGSSSMARCHLSSNAATSEIACSRSTGIDFNIGAGGARPESPSLGRDTRRDGLGSRSGVSRLKSKRRPPTVLMEISLDAGLLSRDPMRTLRAGDGEADGRIEAV